MYGYKEDIFLGIYNKQKKINKTRFQKNNIGNQHLNKSKREKKILDLALNHHVFIYQR